MGYKIGGLDIETTGLDQSSGHRIIEFAIKVYNDGKAIGQYVQRFNPERSIDAKSQAVHGISFQELVKEPIWTPEVAQKIGNLLQGLDLLVAHNMDFDGNFIAGELLRVGVKPPSTPTYCTMENGRWACFDGKLPTLRELCFALGVEYDPSLAHAALYDVERMMECYFRGKTRGFFHQ